MLTVILVWFYFRDTAEGIISCWERSRKRSMAKSEVQKCLDWLLEQKEELEVCPLGFNKQGVLDGAKKLRAKHIRITDYQNELNGIAEKHKLSDDEIHEVAETYQSVKALSDKRSGCFEILSGIAGLEDHIQTLATEFDNKAVHLTRLAENNKEKSGAGLSNESLSRATQNCIIAVRQNWKWINEVMQCAHVHLSNAASYHEFFHEVEEAEYWLNATMSKMHLSFNKAKLNGDQTDVREIKEEMKDTLMAYLRWQSKVDNIFSRAKDIAPVPVRVKPMQEPVNAVALTNYKTADIELFEGENVLVLDNSDRSKWLVENNRKQSCLVPSVIILIPGPTGEAIDAAIRLRIQLLSLWTTSLKRLGYQLIAFMQLVFRDWNEHEITALQSMGKDDRKELLRIMQYIEDSLGKNWSGYRDFENLQEKMSRLRTILEEANDSKREDSEMTSTVVVQLKTLEELMSKYKEFWTYWETHKATVELIRQPKYLLVCDKWDQLRFITTAHFVRFWDSTLQLGGDRTADGTVLIYETPKDKLERLPGGGEDGLDETKVMKTETAMVQATKPNLEKQDSISGEVTQYTETEETETEQVISSVEEVQHTYIITGVKDPRDNKLLTMQEAIMSGVLDQAAGLYTNPSTGKSITIAEALNLGKIKVEITSQKKIKEEKKSYGIITVKTTRETRPYTIEAIIDPVTDEELTIREAADKGIFDPNNQIYKSETGEEIPVLDAIHSGLIKASFHGDQKDSKSEVTKSYAVSGVVDQKRKRKVTFQDAVQLGLLDKDTGCYVNNVTGEKVHVSEAIMKGLIKARVIKDPSTLDIDPENKIVIEKLANVRSKIMKAVKASRAFKANSES
ncbi:hypothetical protein ACJMK2_017721 [Sinanodonta woodiana]|uniref:SH3 domain-containing protein n=2 Tax=Sinanodonta woodiana TaxID=1069815 RepID=A0ABD3UCU1_SINWO